MAAICSLLRPEFIIRAQPPSAFWPVTASEGRMRFIKGSPASKRRAFSRMMAMVAACRSGTWGVQCGVMYTVGMCQSGESGESGCSSNTSNPAPERVPSFKASIRSSVQTRPPRAMFTRNAPGLQCRKVSLFSM